MLAQYSEEKNDEEILIILSTYKFLVLAKIINRLFHEKSTKHPYRSKENTNL